MKGKVQVSKAIKGSLLASLVMLLAAPRLTNANSEKDYRDNVQWAKDTIGQNQSKAGYSQFNVNDLCKDAACEQEVANPTQSRYHSNPSSMTGDAQRYSITDEQSQAVTTSFNKGRPTIDPNDPAYHAAVGYQNDAYNISHGISSKYHDCEKGLRCEVGTTTKSCTVPTNLPVQCHITPYISDKHTQIKEYHFSLTGTPPLTIKLPETNNITAVMFNGNVSTFFRPNNLKFTLNDTFLGTASISGTGSCGSDGMCPSAISTSFPYTNSTDTLSLMIKGAFNSSVDPSQGSIIRVRNLPITIITNKTIADIGYRNSCGALLPECQQTTHQCIEGKATRIIDGVSVTLDCWKEQITYKCNTPNTCASLSECTKQSSTCETSIEGVCITQKEQRLCETQQCQDVGLICGEDSFSLSGDYYDPDAQRSTDFNQAAAGLAAVGEAGQDLKDATNINENSEIIFKGEVMSCTNKPIGLSNCCQDKGWGNDLGITSCSEEEKALGTAKEDKLTVSLGEYCAEKVLGVCIRKKKAYCTFGSKLARIVQEAGRAQLNMDFGSAKHPDCRALSPNELQKIDMSQMDFSDFYEDLHDGMITPDVSEIQKRLQQSVKQGGN
ncbi:type-F conjugative transfer system mating-pair stabilization protein TraN [Shewanella colwelliana]|uniref:type-F conjugative transfer system mating-pair stabilization protein TraN n=1 Tax=Shewanella colwelliana TaxID=23 RepID=UPI003734C5EA